MEPTFNQPSPVIDPQPVSGGPKKKKTLWIVIGLVVVVIVGLIIVMASLMNKPASNEQQKAVKKDQPFTVEANPYLYACSVATIEDFKKTFALSGPDNIGSVSTKNPLKQATTSEEPDLTKLASYAKSGTYPSTCDLTVTPAAGAKTVISIDTTIDQFASSEKAENYLKGRRRFEERPDKVPVTLPSLPDSVVTLPSAEGASHTIKAVALHKNAAITISHMVPGGATTESTLPKIDAFMQAIIARADDKSAATKPTTLDGHATMIDKPFINTCTNIGLTEVAKKLNDINLRPDEITHSGQYGALTGSSAAGDGVLSSCRLTFGTPDEAATRAESSTSKSSSSLDGRKLYPHTLLLSTNRYGSPAAAKAAMLAKKERQRPLFPDMQDIQGIGDGGYKLHKATEIADFSPDGSNKRSTVEDAYTLQSGTNLIVISLQQSHTNSTSPVTVTDSHIKNIYPLFKTMLSK